MSAIKIIVMSFVLAAIAIHAMAGELPPRVRKPLTLREAVEKSLSYYPEVDKAQRQFNISEDQLTIAFSNYFPTIDAVADGGIGYNSNELFENDVISSVRVGLEISQLIYDFGRTSNSVRAAEVRKDGARLSLQGTQIDVAAQTTFSFVVVSILEEKLNVAVANYEAHKKITEEMNAKFGAGSPEHDLAVERETQAHTAKFEAIKNLEQAEEVLAALVGLTAKELKNQFDLVIPVFPQLPTDGEEAFDIALSTNPELKAARLEVVAANFEIRAADAESYPKIHARTRVGYSESDYVLKDKDNYSAGVGAFITVPIFAGGSIRARQERAREAAGIAEDNNKLAEIQVQKTIFKLYISIQQTKKQIKELKETIEASKRVLANFRSEFKAGRLSLLDYVDQVKSLYESEQRLWDVEAEHRISKFTIVQLTGQLLDNI